jgi:hypothetical protein
MKKIPLTQGKFALVDDEDYDWLMQWKWHATNERGRFYAVRTVWGAKQKSVRMHREILGLKYKDGLEGDHANGNTLDDRRCNLRIVTNYENKLNQHGVKGYHYDPHRHRYRAEIWVRGKKKPIGDYLTPDEAHAAYLIAKAIYHVIPERKIV